MREIAGAVALGVIHRVQGNPRNGKIAGQVDAFDFRTVSFGGVLAGGLGERNPGSSEYCFSLDEKRGDVGGDELMVNEMAVSGKCKFPAVDFQGVKKAGLFKYQPAAGRDLFNEDRVSQGKGPLYLCSERRLKMAMTGSGAENSLPFPAV